MSQYFFGKLFYNTKNGNTYQKARLYFYETGTFNFKDVYSDAQKTQVLENPVIADGAGRFPAIFMDTDADYRVWLKDRFDMPVTDYEDDVSPSTSGSDLRGEVVETFADFATTTASFDYQVFALIGHTVAGIGGGQFYYDPTDTTSADDGGTIAVNGSGQRFKRALDGYVTPDMFGALHDGSDSLTAFTAAISYIDSKNGGTLKGHGDAVVYRVSNYFEPCSNLKIEDVNIKKSSGQADDRIIYLVPVDENGGIDNFRIINCTLDGTWDENPREEGSNGLLTLKYCSNITIINSTLKNSRFFTINANLCDTFNVFRTNFKYGTRDMCAIWNTPRVRVESCDFEGNDDDVVSTNKAGFSQDPIRDSIIIKNNFFRDTGGIATQSAKKCIIEGNIIDRCKGGTAIKLSATNSPELFESSSQDVQISSNIITNQIDRSASTDGELPTINFRTAIRIEGLEKTSGVLTNSPSYPDPTTGVPVAPYEYYLSEGDPIRVSFRLKIEGNIVARELPAAANYSDYGFGEMFTRFSTDLFAPTGFVDPEITDTLLQSMPLEVRGALSNCEICGNNFAGSSTTSIKFSAPTNGGAVSDMDLRNVTISDNIFSDCTSYAVDMVDYSGTTQDVMFSKNKFDCDPYFRSSGRDNTAGVYSGGWTSQTTCLGIEASNLNGLKIYDNEFKNCSLPVRQGGTANNIRKRRNVVYSQPVAVGYNILNLGVGTIQEGYQDEFETVYTDCDPTSANYGSVLAQTDTTGAGNPSSGFYTAGYVFRVNAVNTVVKNSVNQSIFAYIRLTTGTGHVLGVDWQALYAEL